MTSNAPTRDPGKGTLWQGVLDAVNLPIATEVAPLSEQLRRVIRGHMANEERSLEEYKALRDRTGDPMIASLMREVLTDEEHHHAMLNRLAEQFEYEMEPKLDGAPISAGPPHKMAGFNGAIETVKTLARHERDGARKLRGVAKANAEVHHGLFSLLLETMAMDSLKHERILRFVARRMEEAKG